MEVDWDSSVAEIGPRLMRYFLVTFSRPIASDLVQEVFIRLVRKCEAGSYDPALGSLAGYAFGIAHYVRLEGLKATLPEMALRDEDDPGVVLPLEAFEQKQRTRRLRAAISQLSEIQRQVVLLYIDQELTLEEIGRILKLPSGTVKSHLHRSRDALKKIMTKETGVSHG